MDEAEKELLEKINIKLLNGLKNSQIFHKIKSRNKFKFSSSR